MTDRYQVIGECAHVVIQDVSGVSAMTLLYKGAFVPDGVDEARLKHLVDSHLVAKVEDVPLAPNAAVGQDPTVGIPTSNPDGGGSESEGPGGDGLHPVLTEEQRQRQREAAEAEQKQADARAQLPSDGSAPDGRKSDAVFVEYLVARGYDRGEVEKASGTELRRLAKDAAKK